MPLFRCSVAVLLLTVLLAGAARAQEPVTAFVNVSVIPMDRERVLAGQTVLVQGSRITAVGPVAQVRIPDGAVRVDGQGRFLIPGLADMHVHLNGGQGDPDPVSGERRSIDTAAIAGDLFTLVANGVTTVREMHSGGKHSAVLALRQRVAAGTLVGPRIYTAGDADYSSAEAIAKTTAELKAAGHDFVKYYKYPRPVYDSLVAVAHRVGLRIGGHGPDPAFSNLGLEDALNDHFASLEHLTYYPEYVMRRKRDLLDHYREEGGVDTAQWLQPSYQLDPARLRQIAVATKRAGTWNCPTLVVLEMAGEQIVGTSRYLDLHFPIVKALHDAGAGLLTGTDAGSGSDVLGFAVHRELELLVRAGLTPYQALETSTRNVAVFLGTADSTGTIAVGKRADMVLLKANPLQDIHATTALAGVMVGGRWLPRRQLRQELARLSNTRALAAFLVWR